MINAKELKKLAAMCRKVGIKSFKSADFEFTLTESEPSSNKKAKEHHEPGIPTSDGLTPQELLFWSTGVATPEAVGSTDESQ